MSTVRQLTRDAAGLDDESLAKAAEEARIMFPNSLWGRLVIAAYEERLAELEEAEAW